MTTAYSVAGTRLDPGPFTQEEAGPDAIAIVTGGSSGPPEAGSPHTQLYRQTFGRLAKSGVSVVGYIHVSYGRRPLQQALAAVRDWYTSYGDLLSGIFVDEAPCEVRRMLLCSPALLQGCQSRR